MQDGSHVMCLTPDRQQALWLILYNFHSLFLKHQMSKVASFEDDKAVEARHSMVMTNLDKTLEIMGVLGSGPDVQRRIRTYFFTKIGMEIIVNALNGWDIHQNDLVSDDVKIVNREFGGLRDLVAQSLQFCYTREELRKAGIK